MHIHRGRIRRPEWIQESASWPVAHAIYVQRVRCTITMENRYLYQFYIHCVPGFLFPPYPSSRSVSPVVPCINQSPLLLLVLYVAKGYVRAVVAAVGVPSQSVHVTCQPLRVIILI